jgi:hypothetical protein
VISAPAEQVLRRPPPVRAAASVRTSEVVRARGVTLRSTWVVSLNRCVHIIDATPRRRSSKPTDAFTHSLCHVIARRGRPCADGGCRRSPKGMTEPARERRFRMTSMDPEDQEFGRKAAEDQDAVDALAEEGVEESDLSDESPRESPRAGRKADEI